MALILSRHPEERVVITDTRTGERVVTVFVVGVKADNVRLGFEAERHYSIHRSEVQEQIDKEGGK